MTESEAHILDPGELFARRYEIKRRIGIGGFGSVYLAVDQNLRREVALKVLDIYESAPNPRAAQQIRKRFAREAMVAGTIQHPSIVQVYDAGSTEHDGWECLFLVMELLEGWNLEDHLYRLGSFRPSTLLPLFVGVLQGLAVGHRREIIHKDLKPGNLFYHLPNSRESRLVVFDFGIARILHEERYTATGHLVGTPQYLAPEYIIDQTVTPRFDVYQMGLILTELLTGVPVVLPRDSFIATCQQHVTGLELPEQVLDSPLGPIIEKACAIDPHERYADAGDFADAIAQMETFEFSMEAEDENVDRGEPALTMPLSQDARGEIRSDREALSGRDTHLFSPDTAKTIKAQLASMRKKPVVDSRSDDKHEKGADDRQSAPTHRVELSERYREPTETMTPSPSPAPARGSSLLLVGVFALLLVLALIGSFLFGAL